MAKRTDAGGPAASVDVSRVAVAVVAAAEEALGRPCGLVEGPSPVLVGMGPDAYGIRLLTDDPRWSGPLVVRASTPDLLRRELRWIGTVAAQGFPTLTVVCDAARHGVVVFRPPPGEHLAARMATDFGSMPRYLATLGQLHARLHAVPVVPRPDGLDGSPVELEDDAAGGVLREELAWLATRVPQEEVRVACHGELYPTHVYLDADGDGLGAAVPVNWTRACLADPTYDVAATLVAFWALPLYVDNAIQRRMIKMARDSLAQAYLDAYRTAAVHPLDEDQLRYWQALHLYALGMSVAARLTGAPLTLWNPATTIAHPTDALNEIRSRFADLTK